MSSGWERVGGVARNDDNPDELAGAILNYGRKADGGPEYKRLPHNSGSIKSGYYVRYVLEVGDYHNPTDVRLSMCLHTDYAEKVFKAEIVESRGQDGDGTVAWYCKLGLRGRPGLDSDTELLGKLSRKGLLLGRKL